MPSMFEMDVHFICYIKPEFQIDSMDMVEQAIADLDTSSIDYEWFFEHLAPEVWTRHDQQS